MPVLGHVADAPVPKRSPRNRRVLVIVLSAIGVLVVLAGVGALWAAHAVGELGAAMHRDDRAKFDRSAWLQADPDDGSREEMLDDLRTNYLKPGISKKEVLAILGKPGGNAPGCWTPLKKESVDSVCYRVSVGLDPCVLLLGFDSSGRFVEAVKNCS
jgi:hypothetical protein